METIAEYLATIDNENHRQRMAEVFDWITKTYPKLAPRIGWNQPMFTDHGTFIIAMSYAKKHMAVKPEWAGLQPFLEEFDAKGLSHSMMIVRFPWDKPVDYDLLGRMIEFNIRDKEHVTTFWRKNEE